MIIKDLKELAPNYTIFDNTIVEIRSNLSLRDIFIKLKNGEDLGKDVLIQSYVIAKDDKAAIPTLLTLADTNDEQASTRPIMEAGAGEYILRRSQFPSQFYSRYVDSRTLQNERQAQHKAAMNKREKLFTDYEQFNFRQKGVEFKEVELDKSLILKEIALALHISPKIYLEDKPVEDLIRMSKNGDRLFREYEYATDRNKLPSFEEIENYEKITPYEKRLIDEFGANPRVLYNALLAVKNQNSGYTLNIRDVLEFEEVSYNSGFYISNTFVDIIKNRGNDSATKEVLEKAENAFKEAFHGHSPRILKEYMEGDVFVTGKKLKNYTDEDIKEAVKRFNQKNISVVAKYRSPILFALSNYLNYGAMRADVTELLASYIDKNSLNLMIKNGFPEWLKEHLDTKTTDMAKVLEYSFEDTKGPDFELEGDEIRGIIKNYDKNLSAKDLVTQITMKKAYDDARAMERKYHYKFEDNELAIKGRDIKVTDGDLEMYMLQKDDYENFTVGIDTHCCQRYGNAGETCVWKYTTDPFAGCVVIKKAGKVVAQAFTWTDEANDTIVFDNMEYANDNNINNYRNIIANWVNAIPYNNMHVGVGYNQHMIGWGKRIKEMVCLPTTLSKNHCYSDYHNDAVALKENGKNLLAIDKPLKVTRIPTFQADYDVLTDKKTAFVLNANGMSLKEKITFAKSFLKEQTPEIQKKAVELDGIAIKSIENPTVEVQKYIVKNWKKYVKYINNPSPEIAEMIIGEDPYKIVSINNPTEAMVCAAVSKDGSLIRYIQNPTKKEIDAALSQNGYAIRYIRQDLLTNDAVELALKTDPKLIALLNNPTPKMQMVAVKKDPNIIGLIHNPDKSVQREVVKMSPGLINDIKNPDYDAVKDAVKKNGMLIRNFERDFPNLIDVALENNPFAVCVLHSPTKEQVEYAVERNPKVAGMLQGNALRLYNQNRENMPVIEDDEYSIGFD